MSDQPAASLSVRGEARRVVAPDSVQLSGQVDATEGSKVAAVAAVSQALSSLTAGLSELGGVPLTTETAKHSLTWSAYSTGSRPEHDHNPETGRHGPTGRSLAWAALVVTAREFTLLEPLGVLLAQHEDFNLATVSWSVDDENPAWAPVRAAAIEAAIGKARDYATALGGSVTSIEHVADVGLLAGGEPRHPIKMSARAFGARSAGGGVDAPSLDPVPQELVALIEARFRTTYAAL